MGTWAYIYARQSDQKNDKRATEDSETLSLEAQVSACRAHAKAQGWIIAGEYAEQFTGTVDDRPKYQAMLGDIKRNLKTHPEGTPGRISKIIVYKYLRLSRDPNYVVPLVGVFRQQGIEIEPVAEQKIGGTPLDELMLYAVLTFGKIQVQDSATHSIAAKRVLEDKGKLVCNGNARYGYQYDKETRARVIDEATAPIVRRIFQELAAGKSARAVEMGLTADQIPTPSGKSTNWSRAAIRGIVKDPSYYGAPFTAGKSRPQEGRYKNGHKRRGVGPGQREVGGSSPIIVDRKIWDRANVQISNRSIKPIRYTHWLQGRITCECCKRNMIRCSHHSGGWYWRCPNYVETKSCPQKNGYFNSAWVEEYVIRHLMPFLTDPRVRESRLQDMREAIISPEWEVETTRNAEEINKLRGKIGKLIAKFGDDPDLTGILDEQIGEIKNQLKVREDIAKGLAGRTEDARRAEETVGRTRTLLADWDKRDLFSKDGAMDAYKSLPDEELALLAETVGLMVLVGRGLSGAKLISVRIFNYLAWMPLGQAKKDEEGGSEGGSEGGVKRIAPRPVISSSLPGTRRDPPCSSLALACREPS
jgi:DNA invertase Pin-like site-specific DNA recombinase